jgi:uncharacterized protein (TIRG00374 family)
MARNELGKIYNLIVNLNKAFFTVSFILFLIISFLVSFRFKLLLKVQNIFLSLKESAKLTFIGYFFNNFLPSSLGGDLARGYYAFKSTNKKLSSFTTIFVDRLVGVTAMVFLMGIAFIFIQDARENKVALSLAIIVISLVLFALLFLLNRSLAKKLSFMLRFFIPFKLNEKLRPIYNSINKYKDSKKLLLEALVISFLVQLLVVLIFFVLSKSINMKLPLGFKDLFWVVPLSSIVSMLPSINGIGVREGAFVYFLRRIVNPEIAISISLLFLGLTIFVSLIGGVVYIFMKTNKGKEYKAPRLNSSGF